MTAESLNGKKILIVEDDLSSRLYLNKILEKTGATLLNAGDGSEAVDIIASGTGIDLILMDIQLPVMDGYTAAARIREIKPGIKIIAQTAYSLSGDMEALIASGFDDYIIKPIFSGQLIEKISQLLEQIT
ncbi:MAG TPA: response regulator [Bacteroidales bacterium]|nr:response regulator [Bacteroidales bacterium]HPF03774.1 response regulator [Bacteroidales bacterium]HPJ58599.1 response regulator [Bacteroidales bacterium]HPR11242.1 response regulator [Bacteroidales bacterium]HRW86514.1 response regulator [Bacteroidales bacterium]